jgi:hypothetical protein
VLVFQKLSPQEVLLKEFSAEEKANLLQVPAASNLEDLRLFVKVCRYFNGKYHLVKSYMPMHLALRSMYL